MKSNTYCVIMAGGVGSRFWPISRTSSPKQFLDILGTGKTLLQQTFERFRPICPLENMLVVTSKEYVPLVLEQLPELTPRQILSEPFRRNTAPCIALANAHIKKRNPEAMVVVTPSDHLILQEEKFRMTVSKGVQFAADHEVLLTLGIKPHKPETQYGYIQVTQQAFPEYPAFYKVKTFTEKPNQEMASLFYETGEFFWNSGVFIWSVKSIEKAYAKYLPLMKRQFEHYFAHIQADDEHPVLEKTYMECEQISIDYGLMEKADNVFVQLTDVGWSDLGTWESLYERSPKDEDGNVTINGKSLLMDTRNCIIHLPHDKVCVVEGLDNYLVVESKNALLICPKNNQHKIRQFSTQVKTDLGMED